MLTDALSVAYHVLGQLEPYYLKQAEKVAKCSPWLKFGLKANGTRELMEAFFCHARLCSMCQWRKSRMLQQQLLKVFKAHRELRVSDRALFLTLTVRNVDGSDLNTAIDTMTEGIRRLMMYKRIKGAVTGWYRALEVTYNPETGEYHPHYHVLLMVRGEYFNKQAKWYIPQPEWVAMWGRALGVDYLPSVDIRAVNGRAGAEMSERTRKALAEVTKYAAKPQDIYSLSDNGASIPSHIVKVLHDSLAGRRLVGWGGLFKKLHKELNLADVDDENVDLTRVDDAVPEGSEIIAIETYTWGIGATRRPDYYLRRLESPQEQAA